MLQTAATTETASPRLGGLDLAGVILSGICLVHCTLLPVLLAMLPFLGAHYEADERLHLLVTVLVVPVAMLALLTGFRRHRLWWVPLLGLCGLALILAAPALHETLGHTLEGVLTALGGLGLISAHLVNWRNLHAPGGCCSSHHGCCAN